MENGIAYNRSVGTALSIPKQGPSHVSMLFLFLSHSSAVFFVEHLR